MQDGKQSGYELWLCTQQKLNELKDNSSVARMKRSVIRGRGIAAIPVLRLGFIRATHSDDKDCLLI